MGGRISVSFAEGAPDARRGPRYRVLLVARLFTTTGERIVKLRDISATGAMVEGDRLPAAGTDILLQRGSLELFATIVWARDGQAGLEFDQPLTEAELWRQVDAPPLAEVEAEPAPSPERDPIAAFNRSFGRQ